MKRSAYWKHLISLLMFGSNGIVARYIGLSSIQIVLLRTLLGSSFLGAIFLLSRESFTFHRKRKDFLFLIISGIAMGTSWMFLYEAYARIGVSIAILLYYCGPVIVMVLSPLLFRERLTVGAVVGFLVVLCGVVLINGNVRGGEGDLFGVVCGLLSAVTYAMMVIFNKKAKTITGLENSVLQLAIAFVTVGVFVGLKQGYAMEITGSNIIPILVLGVLNTGLGCYLYFSSISSLPVQTVAVCGYMEPLSAVVFAFVFLRETMLPMQLLGGACIIGGALFSELYKKDRCLFGKNRV